MDRYVGDAKGDSGSTKDGAVEADRLAGCGKEGGGHSEGSVEKGEEGRVSRCEGGVEGEVAVCEDAGVEKGDNSRAGGRGVEGGGGADPENVADGRGDVEDGCGEGGAGGKLGAALAGRGAGVLVEEYLADAEEGDEREEVDIEVGVGGRSGRRWSG
ncbi:uncharacterized protein MONOS_14846 [Monocercomonoides exilis]|uniref:uncharacterized protein n=1 Tax=Monocercomonoides exilis TaxID=2049356 RepID=UPI00355A0244|nr:hypothetical protein MONOS_14846 [Monocercomonoides exilis]|eukprot:MONOS_14846.1-p1 / transcript=MONOS_14846.1 / gene=MONOS_14846 / organism=Monocercomonoides_exilis_PA203 / gene_product=unspecified product / transcript_product=unspecified product / location=Mono_scaffold01085:16385-16948(+) / protein_length=157 / sequence_SO=supercontig / SO=protein_coding / is_pseudo=false